MEQFDLFSVPLIKHQNFISDDEANKIFDDLKDDTTAIKHKLVEGDAKSTARLWEVHILDRYPNIKSQTQEAVDEYTESVGITKTNISASWYNLQQKESTLLPHSHPAGHVSGQIIINADQDSSGVFFKNPHYDQQYFCWWLTAKETKYNKEYEKFKVRTGDLFIFPSYLVHGGAVNFTKNRLVIAFDATFVDNPQ
jgi:hypothetical protein